jgi:hypothetical protein
MLLQDIRMISSREVKAGVFQNFLHLRKGLVLHVMLHIEPVCQYFP